MSKIIKCIKVIESCKTEDQLWVAHNYIELFNRQNKLNKQDRNLLSNFWNNKYLEI